MNNPMITIHLSGLKFFSYHGVFDEERILGNDFVVDVELSFQPPEMPVSQLDQTINYEQVFMLVQLAMDRPTPLLETVVTTLSAALRQRFPEVQRGKISIEKCSVPVEGWQGSARVEYQW